MIIIGHRFIPSDNLYHVTNIDAIKKTPPSSSIFLDFSEENLDTINYAIANNIPLALGVKNIKETLFASSLGASYILVDSEFASLAQNLANEYLFDAKILVIIEDEDEMQDLALSSIDGVVFKNAIIKTTS